MDLRRGDEIDLFIVSFYSAGVGGRKVGCENILVECRWVVNFILFIDDTRCVISSFLLDSLRSRAGRLRGGAERGRSRKAGEKDDLREEQQRVWN